jgi:amino acid permease
MTHQGAFGRFAFAFGTAFGPLYALALAKNLALFTVYPSLGLVLWGTRRARDVVDPAMGFLAPAMYWYGWAATAGLGALVVGLLALAIPDQLVRWMWTGWLWVIPSAAMLACVYFTLPWFSLNP